MGEKAQLDAGAGSCTWSRSLSSCVGCSRCRQVTEKTAATPPATPLDFTRPLSPETQDEMEAERAPPPATGPSTDGVRQRRRWKQDTLASEDRLMARTDPMQTNTHQAVESLKNCFSRITGEVQVKYREALADFAETYDPRRHGDAVPGNLRRRPTSNWKGSNLPSSSFGASLMQLRTTIAVTLVFSSVF